MPASRIARTPITASQPSKTWTRFSGNLGNQYTQDRSTISTLGLGWAYGAPIGEVNRRSEPGAHSTPMRSVKVLTRLFGGWTSRLNGMVI